MDLAALGQWARTLAGYGGDALAFFREPSSLTQIGVVLACLVAAFILDRLTRSTIERQARRIRGAPRLLRLVAALRRRMALVYFTAALWIATLFDTAAGGPRSAILTIVFKLALAYLVIAVLSRIVRTRFVSRIITGVAMAVAALSILNLLGPVSDSLDRTAITVGEGRISALLVIKALIVVAISLWIASALGNFLDTRLQRSKELTPTLRVLIGKVVKIGLVLVALAVALASVGVDLTALTVLSGAIGVGLGFGLQKVVSNFISGIIILTDRSIKPGDTISVGETYGWIRELRARFVSVVTRDGKEYLIPNEDFITNQVVNWSFSNELVRIEASFGVHYDCDPHEVIRIAKDAVVGVPRIVDGKPVVCWLTAFGESSLDFVLRFWIRDPSEGVANVKGQVLLALWDAFKDNAIEIPYPHREVYLHRAPPVGADKTEP